MNNKPIQYQRGYVEFYKLRFKVTLDVLIPRPETELLVDAVLQFASKLRATNHEPLTVLDLGTGTGNIAISIAKNLSHPVTQSGYAPGVTIIATDISSKALTVARQNAKLNGVQDKITFIKSDLLSAFCHSQRSEESLANVRPTYAGDPSLITQDDNLIIVTNLPYIPAARIPYLDSSVKDFEPHVALDGGDDGFELYRKLFAQIKEKGWKSALIIGEIDYTHKDLACNEAYKYFPEAEIEVKKDLAHLQRVLTIKFPQ